MVSGPGSGQLGWVRWKFTDRAGGVSAPPYDTFNLGSHVGDDPDAVGRNRELLLERVDGARRLATMRASHGTGVAVVTDEGEVLDVDALVSSTPGLALLTLGADCVPVVLFDPRAAVVAAVHAGWAGLRDDVVGGALDRMIGIGADPGRIRALLGPSICGACYAVPPERAEQVGQVAPRAIRTARDGQPSIDLRRGLGEALVARGVTVTEVGGCTAENDSLFSYRRDGITGRHGAVVVAVK